MSERDAPGVLAASQHYFSSGESSRRGKAGALWETAFPLLRPLPPFPRSLAATHARPAKPELARPLAISSLPLAPPADKESPVGSRIHSSSPGSGFAFAAASESRPSSFGMDCGTTRGLQGKSRRESASRNHQRLRSSRTLGRKEGATRSSPARQAACFSKLTPNPPLSPQAA